MGTDGADGWLDAPRLDALRLGALTLRVEGSEFALNFIALKQESVKLHD
jgi:hypothetical protein